MDEVRGRVRVEWPAVFGSDFVQAIAGVISKLREDGRDPTFDDYVVSISLDPNSSNSYAALN
jgi:hypothetical protein